MKIPKFNLRRSLFFSLVLLTPLIAVTDLVRAENVNSRTSERANSANSLDFSQNLGEKLQEGFLLAKPGSKPGPKPVPKPPTFKLVEDGPTYVRYIGEPTRPRPKPKLQDSEPENISALQTFESLLG
jgi:hypothetical protein